MISPSTLDIVPNVADSLAQDEPSASDFPSLNPGYNAVFQPNRLTVGLVVPIERYPGGPVPKLTAHLERAQLAEKLGFAAVWLRDVPFNVPAFGDAGQLFDPFVYLGMLAGQTKRIALGVASIILPLRHPVHVAKAAASVDQLSGGRLILGVASGDRPEEYPTMGVDFETRGELFRQHFNDMRRLEKAPDLLPNPLREGSRCSLQAPANSPRNGWLKTATVG